jgi:hypothetical protein
LSVLEGAEIVEPDDQSTADPEATRSLHDATRSALVPQAVAGQHFLGIEEVAGSEVSENRF